MRTRPLSYACLLFATLCGAYFLVFFQRLSLGVIMPSLTEDLGLTPSMTGWLGSAFLYAYAATQIPAGLLVDNWGPRRTMLLLFGMGGVGGLLFASAASLGTALAGRALVGVGMAVVTTASFKIMSNWFRAGIYARLVSIFMATGGLGTFFAAAPLAALNTAFGWRPVFRGIAVFSLFWGALLWLMVKDAPSRGRERTPALSSMQRPACIRSGCAHPPGVSAEDRHKRAPESSTSPGGHPADVPHPVLFATIPSHRSVVSDRSLSVLFLCRVMGRRLLPQGSRAFRRIAWGAAFSRIAESHSRHPRRGLALGSPAFPQGCSDHRLRVRARQFPQPLLFLRAASAVGIVAAVRRHLRRGQRHSLRSLRFRARSPTAFGAGSFHVHAQSFHLRVHRMPAGGHRGAA